MNNEIDLDNFEKVTVRFENKKPVEVIDFLISIEAFQKEYKKILEENNLNYKDENFKLYITVKEGSLVWDFFVKIIPDLFTSLSIDTGKHVLKKTYQSIVSKWQDTKANSLESKDIISLDNSQKILQPSVKDLSAKLSFKYSNKNGYKEEKLEFEIMGDAGKGVYDSIGEHIKRLKNESSEHLEINNEILELVVSQSQSKGNLSIRGVIETIDTKPKILTFQDRHLRDQFLENNKNNPFLKYYVVNGNIKKRDNKILTYDITELVEVIDN